MSDLLSNTTRGVLAEFVVGSALGLKMDVRHEWDAVDLVTADGHRIEVKSSAYLQAWTQAGHSKVQFSVARTRRWIPETRKYETESKRQADVYVFALLAARDPALVDPLDLTQWEFFVVAATQLDRSLRDQRSLSLEKLKTLAPPATGYSELAGAVRECMASVATSATPVK